jgi:excisionase family DNA binding protein
MVEMTNGENPFEGWTNIEEAAELVGRHKATVQNWAKQGFITSYPLGKKTRVVNIEEVKAYAATHLPHKRKHPPNS